MILTPIRISTKKKNKENVPLEKKRIYNKNKDSKFKAWNLRVYQQEQNNLVKSRLIIHYSKVKIITYIIFKIIWV